MRAVFEIVARQHLTHQRLALTRLGVIARLDGCLAGDGVQKLVPERLRRKRPALEKMTGKLGKTGPGVLGSDVGRNAAEKHRAVAEVLDAEAVLLQKRGVFQHGGGLLPAQGRWDRRKQQLRHDRGVLLFELFKKDALMRGVLVDEKHGVLFFYNNIGVQRLADDAPRLLPERDRILLRRRVGQRRLGLFRCSGRCLFQLGFNRHSRFFRLRRSKRRKRSFLRLFGGRLRRSGLRLDPGLAAAEKRSLKIVREHADRPCRTRGGCRAERGGRLFRYGAALRYI